jgi:HD-like signal output (HDOD) protein
LDSGINRWTDLPGGARDARGKSPATTPGSPGNAKAGAPTPADSDTVYATEAGAPLTGEELALQAELTRVLHGRCEVLMRAAGAEARQSDAPMVIECLLRLDDAVIRQPPVAGQRALAVVRNPLSGSAQLVGIFERDPALTESLLQTANSSYYHRGSEPCIAIAEAVQRVGARGVESIITMKMIEGVQGRLGSTHSLLQSQVWAHMTRTAPIARSLARPFQAVPESAFTVGLLHDMGKLMMFDYLSQLRAIYVREIKLPERFLLDMLNRLHEPLGGIAALRWNLGVGVAHAIAWHHREPPPTTRDLLGELVCLSERVEHCLLRGAPVDIARIWREAGLETDAREVLPLLRDVPGVSVTGTEGAKGRDLAA